MSSGTTIVGSVKYDASIDLESLKKSVQLADQIVRKSYENQEKASKKYSKSSTKSSSSGGNGATEAQMRINNIKREAQETATTLSKYTPQIQKQFLTVERSNNQVAKASERSFQALQRYGAGSSQATNATNALNVAVQNQSQQQAKLTSMLNGSYKSQNNFTSGLGDSIIAIGGVVAGLSLLNATMATLQRSVAVANQYEASIAGLSRISERYGYDAREATKASQELAEDGLITVATSAGGLQKLLIAGVGLPEAIELMRGYKDQASLGKSSTIDLDTAVGNLAESFYTENSAIGNLSGQTENWNQILEYGASALGKQVSQLNDKERVQAKIIGQQRLNNLVEGDSAILAETNAGKQARLNATLLEVQTTIGRLTNEITGGFIGALSDMNAEGQHIAIAFGAGVTAFVGFLTVVPLAITAFRTIRSALVAVGVASAFASGGITALLGGLVAIGAGVTVANLIDNLESTEELSDKFSQNVAEASSGLGTASKNASDTAKNLAKINDQMEEARENYRYSLAQLVAEKNENIATLSQTLSEEERAYNNAFKERQASFAKTQDEELLTHEQKTRALQNQIDFLTKYNTQANQEQLEELRFALARENAEYQKSTQLRQAEFDTQTQSAKDEYEARREENQKKLNEELALLQKHRQEVLAVRNVMLLDEIQTLQKQRDEQLKSLEQQKNDMVNTLTSAGATAGKNSAQAFSKAFGAEGIYFDTATRYKVQTIKGQKYVTPEFADGGFTGTGNKHDVAGIVHAGEYVLPKEQVNQTTGLPKPGALGDSTQNITVNLSLSGVMTSSKSDERAIATRIGKLINEAVKSKTGKTAIAGV